MTQVRNQTLRPVLPMTEEVQLNKSDICIMTNACMTDSATLGSLYKPAPAPEKKPISGELWGQGGRKEAGPGKSGAILYQA